MVNPVQIAPVQLAGRGFVYRPDGGYRPGEYRRLVNMEIDDNGELRKRMPVEIGSSQNLVTSSQFIGFLEDWVVVALNNGYSDDTLYFTKRDGSGENTNIVWDTDNLYGAGFDPASDDHVIVGFFRYNGRNYFLSISENYTGTTQTNKFYLHYFNANTSEDVTVLPLVFQHDIPQNHVLLFTIAVDNHGMFGVAPFKFKKFFWHRDRLWIITNRGVYFSKATDPTNFTAPDGGFFRYPDDLVKDAVALHDDIFVLGNDNLNYITYVSDPNTDATQREIARGIGGDALVVHEDACYLVRIDQLYLVETNRISKVLDLDLGIGGYDLQLVSYFDYIIFQYYSDVTFFVSPNQSERVPVYGSAGQTLNEANNVSHWYTGTFFLNMKTGSMMEFMYQERPDQFDPNTSDPGKNCTPVAWFPQPFEHTESGEYWLWFRTYGDPTFGNTGHTYTMKMSSKDNPGEFTPDVAWDFGWRNAPALANGQSIPILVDIPGINLDGSEIWVKKIRSIALEGKFPPSYGGTEYDLKLELAFDNQPYPITPPAYNFALDLNVGSTGTFNDTARLPVPSRFPVNQRARELSVRFREDIQRGNGTTLVPAYNAGPFRHFILNRISIFWTPTNRGPINRQGN